MADYGFQSWDANGTPNNYGIKPVSVQGFQALASGQKAGTWVIPVPPGLRLNYYHVPANADSLGPGRRRVTVSGGTITVSPAGDLEYTSDTYPAGAAFLIFTIEKTQ